MGFPEAFEARSRSIQDCYPRPFHYEPADNRFSQTRSSAGNERHSLVQCSHRSALHRPVRSKRFPKPFGKPRRILPGETFEYERVQLDGTPQPRRSDLQPLAVACVDLADFDLCELVADAQGYLSFLARAPHYRKIARLCVGRAVWSSSTSRLANLSSPPTRRSASQRSAASRLPADSPCALNTRRLLLTDSSAAVSPGSTRTLPTKRRVLEGGSSDQANSLSKRSTRALSEPQSSTMWKAVPLNSDAAAARSRVTRTGMR